MRREFYSICLRFIFTRSIAKITETHCIRVLFRTKIDVIHSDLIWISRFLSRFRDTRSMQSLSYSLVTIGISLSMTRVQVKGNTTLLSAIFPAWTINNSARQQRIARSLYRILIPLLSFLIDTKHRLAMRKTWYLLNHCNLCTSPIIAKSRYAVTCLCRLFIFSFSGSRSYRKLRANWTNSSLLPPLFRDFFDPMDRISLSCTECSRY